MTYPILTTLIQSADKPQDLPYQLVPNVPSAFLSVRHWSGKVWNQFRQGSCTAQAVRNAVELFLLRAGVSEQLSAQFLYDMSALVYEAWRVGLSGRMMVDALTVAWKYGVPLESEWPTREGEATLDPRLFPAVMASAATRKLIRFERIPIGSVWTDPGEYITAAYYRSAYYEGCPVVEARAVFRDIFALQGPLAQQVYRDPNVPGNDYVGAHAMCSVEWQDALDGIVDEQSWGTEGPGTGESGFIRLPRTSLGNVMEAWAVRGVRAHGVDYYIDPCFVTDQRIRDYVNEIIAQNGGLNEASAWQIWSAKVQFGIQSAYLESVMGWPAGSVDQYAVDHGWL